MDLIRPEVHNNITRVAAATFRQALTVKIRPALAFNLLPRCQIGFPLFSTQAKRKLFHHQSTKRRKIEAKFFLSSSNQAHNCDGGREYISSNERNKAAGAKSLMRRGKRGEKNVRDNFAVVFLFSTFLSSFFPGMLKINVMCCV